MKRLAKEYTYKTHRHRRQCGDGQREWGWGLGGGRQGVERGMGISVILSAIKKKTQCKTFNYWLFFKKNTDDYSHLVH